MMSGSKRFPTVSSIATPEMETFTTAPGKNELVVDIILRVFPDMLF